MVARYAGAESPRLAEGRQVARGPRSRLMRRAALALATLAIGALALGAHADAYIYWANDATPQHSVVGRAGLDGTGIDQSFIPSANITEGVAVDSTYIYWSNVCSGAIGRANIDGSGVLNQSFITGANSPPGCGPPAIAVDQKHIYWTNLSSGAIGRANIDGSGVNQSFITAGVGVEGIAVDGTHIYWAQRGDAAGTAIGRANLNGMQVNPSFITGSGSDDYDAVAVDAKHIYWTNFGPPARSGAPTSTAGRSTRVSSSAPTNPSGVAVDATHIYWTTNPDSNGATTPAIGRANLNGRQVDQNFIAIATGGFGLQVAVDALPATCAGSDATIAGTGRSDKLRGTTDDDVIAAGRGDDTVTGLEGDDLVCGARGDDVLRGKGGDDELRGGAGATSSGAAADRTDVAAGRLGQQARLLTNARAPRSDCQPGPRCWRRSTG